MELFFCSFLTLFIAAERLFAATHRGLCPRHTDSTYISTV